LELLTLTFRFARSFSQARMLAALILYTYLFGVPTCSLIFEDLAVPRKFELSSLWTVISDCAFTMITGRFAMAHPGSSQYHVGDRVPHRFNAPVMVASCLIALLGSITTVEILHRKMGTRRGWINWYDTLFSAT
jgi:hypothetical protein